MALVKVRRAAQITLPAEVREKLNLREGDYLEAEITERGVLLKPIALVERQKAWEELMEIVDTPKWRKPMTMSPEEEEDMIFEEVEALRHRP